MFSALLLFFFFFIEVFICPLIGHVMRGCQLSAALYSPSIFTSTFFTIGWKKEGGALIKFQLDYGYLD